ncbi:MAG: oligosaccharide flippase family protein [Phycisphaerales bacterium JB054]
MTPLRRAIAGGGVVGGAHVAGQVMALARQVIVARLLGPEEFGLGVAFFVVIALIEMIADLGVDRLLLQGSDGDDARLQRGLHFVQLARGAGLAALVASTGPWIASLFGRPDAAWAFSALAVVPLLRGFYHLDVLRSHRTYRFGPQARGELVAQGLTLAAAWPLAAWEGTYASVMYLMVLQTAVYLVMTHLLADRRFSCRFERDVTRTALKLGWPLLINGVLMFAISQGERVAVIRVYGEESLAFWGVAAMLAMRPSGVFSRVANIVGMPFLAQSAASDRVQYAARARRYMLLTAGAALAGLVPLVLVGDVVLGILYGAAYGPACVLMPALAAGQTARLARGSVSVAAISGRQTATPMMGNLLRAAGLGIVVWMAVEGASLASLALASAGAEAVAALGGALFATHRGRLPAGALLAPSAGVIAAAGAALALHAWAPSAGAGHWGAMVAGALVSMCCGMWLIVRALDRGGAVRRLVSRVGAGRRAVV